MWSRILGFVSSLGLIPGCGCECGPAVAPGGRGSRVLGFFPSGGRGEVLRGYPARMVGSACRVVSTCSSSRARVPGGGRRTNRRADRGSGAGRLISSRRMRASVRRARPRPSSIPVISWIQFEMAHASNAAHIHTCLLYTSDAADEEDSVDLGGRRIIKKKK